MTNANTRAPLTIKARNISCRFQPAFGLLESFSVHQDERSIAPLHRAPWVGTEEIMPEDADPHLAVLGGDFFCAPFAARDGTSPLHGWPPNSGWHVERHDTAEIEAFLHKRVFGAKLRKWLTVRDDHPFVYQRHRFSGGSGHFPCANHANVSVPGGAHIRTSPKSVWETPAAALEPDPKRGRSCLVYPARQPDPSNFPGQDGPVNLTRYPWHAASEDFVAGIEAPGRTLGWTAVSRLGSGDLFLSLRNPGQLPMTMLWHSNGGRDYAPWSGRHLGCLGVEEGAAGHMLGQTPETEIGGPGAITLGQDTEIRHVIGALSWPTEEPVSDVTLETGQLVIRGTEGAVKEVAFDASFLTRQ